MVTDYTVRYFELAHSIFQVLNCRKSDLRFYHIQPAEELRDYRLECPVGPSSGALRKNSTPQRRNYQAPKIARQSSRRFIWRDDDLCGDNGSRFAFIAERNDSQFVSSSSGFASAESAVAGIIASAYSSASTVYSGSPSGVSQLTVPISAGIDNSMTSRSMELIKSL